MSKSVDKGQLTVGKTPNPLKGTTPCPLKGREYTKMIKYTYHQNGKKVTEEVMVLIYEDQPEQLTEATAKALFEKYPEVKAIHELNFEWGGCWARKSIMKAVPGSPLQIAN